MFIFWSGITLSLRYFVAMSIAPPLATIRRAELEDFLVSSTLSHSEMMNVTQLRKGSEVLLATLRY